MKRGEFFKMRNPGDGEGEKDPHMIVSVSKQAVILFSIDNNPVTSGNTWSGSPAKFLKTFCPIQTKP